VAGALYREPSGTSGRSRIRKGKSVETVRAIRDEIGAVALAIGIAAALALTRFLSGLLFGVGARDPVTFVALPLGLLLVAILAAFIPAGARRARESARGAARRIAPD
jgi:hypothetical protein